MAFIVLKLVGVIQWSWWWVLSPIWIPICFVVAVILVLKTIAAVLEAVD